jgi:hypothetical protein
VSYLTIKNIHNTNKMILACYKSNKAYSVYDYDTRATAYGYIHEIASTHSSKSGWTCSSIHGSPNIIVDHYDSDNKLFIGAYTLTTTDYSKYLLTSNTLMNDINYLEGTSLVIAVAYYNQYNVEIHDSTHSSGSIYLSANVKTGQFSDIINQSIEIRNGGLNVIVTGEKYLKGWNRSNLNTSSLLWSFPQPNNEKMFALASKTTTTWFLGAAYN